VTTSLHDLRILVLAGDPLARAGLAALLSQEPGCQVVGQAPADADLAAELAAARPDVLVWDLGWAPAAALERLAELGAPPNAPPLLVLLPADDTVASTASQAWRAGARGLLDRNTAPTAIVAAARGLALGLTVLEQDLADKLLLPLGLEQSVPALIESLTSREDQVLQLMAEGLTNRAIALRLGISEHTVKFHVNAILGKLAAQSRADAVMRATRLGLILL
jgi:DNA-binding NarL/FixJ family response regulator